MMKSEITKISNFALYYLNLPDLKNIISMNNIVLHIPHSSSKMIYDGWDNISELRKHIQKWTDFDTDKLFLPSHCYNIPINSVVGEYSRFTVDFERLPENEPLEKIGQGIIYTKYGNCVRVLNSKLTKFLLSIYEQHYKKLRSLLNANSLLIDCHSFPDELSDDVDICIGFNDDWSKPDENLLNTIISVFESRSYVVGLNTPYSNSVSPKMNFEYKSVMIEVNKRIYMNNLLDFKRLSETIYTLYSKLERLQ